MHGYEIKESNRSRAFRATVHPDGRVVITKPVNASDKRLTAFIEKSAPWIGKQQRRFSKLPPQVTLPKPRKNSKAYKEAREAARALVLRRLPELNAPYGLSYGTISIRDQKTRWGSCSAKGNLSFNYRIAFLPPELADYLLVHELCHLKEHNHSERFWGLVERAVPGHRALRKELRTRYSLGEGSIDNSPNIRYHFIQRGHSGFYLFPRQTQGVLP